MREDELEIGEVSCTPINEEVADNSRWTSGMSPSGGRKLRHERWYSFELEHVGDH